MPWAAIPHGNFHINDMMQTFGITKLPCLVVLRKDGTVLIEDACDDIMNQGPRVFTSWEQSST